MKKFWAALKKYFTDPRRISNDARAIVRALRIIKTLAASPAALAITAAIPGNTDERVRQALVNALEKLLFSIDQAHALANKLPHDDQLRNAVIHKAGSIALRELHKISEAQADTIIQNTYELTKD